MSALTSSSTTTRTASSSSSRREWSSKRGVRTQATGKASPAGPSKGNEGTQVLKGLPSLLGSGTLSLKPGAGTQKIGTIFSSLTGTIGRSAKASPGDAKTVFVAGSTGRTGARVVRELVKAGFKVRAGARNVEEAQKALDVAAQYGLLSAQDVKAVQIVQVDYSKADSIKAAIGNARKVVSALGAAETQALNLGEPKKVDFEYTVALINAAASAGVQQFVLVTSLGTGKVGFPASILNLFGGILYWKREAEKALEASGIAYTIVRPGGMERPTDSHKKTHNMILSPRDTTFGGTVSRLQVAELVGTILINPELAENKVLEVTSETTAPKLTYQELLAGINSDISREEQEAAKEAVLAARQLLEEAEGKAESARAALAAADGRVKELADRLKSAKAQEAEVKAKVAPTLKEGASAEKALLAAKAAADKAALQEAAAKAVLEAAKKAAGQGQLLDKKQLKAVADAVLNPPPPAAKPAAAPALAAAGAAPTGTTSTNPLFGFLAAAAAPPAAPAAAPAAPPAAAAKPAPPPAKPAPPPAKPAAGGFSFGSLFGLPGAATVQVDTDAPAKAPSPPPRSAAPPPAPAAATPKKAPEPPKPAAAPAAPPAPPAKKEEPQPLFAGLFGKPISVEDVGNKVSVPPRDASPPPKPAAAAAAAPAAAPPKPAAPPPAPEPPKPAAAAPKPAAAAAPPPPPAPKPAAPPKPAVPVEDPAEVERRALAALAEERRQKALQEAKARLAAEAAAVERAKAAAREAAKQKAPSPEPPKPAPPNDAQIAAEKKKVQEWISAWQARQSAANNGAPAPAAAAAAPSNGVVKPAKAGGYDEAAAQAAKLEAQKWIAAWQAKQKAGVKP